MFKLIESRDAMPKSLFITNITTKMDLEAVGASHIGRSIFRGEHKGQQVALRVVYKVHDNVSAFRFPSPRNIDAPYKDMLGKDVWLEVLKLQSLAHDFILPLLGIFEERSHLFLVSPFMTNGTIAEWRKNRKPDVKEIHRLVGFWRLSEEINEIIHIC